MITNFIEKNNYDLYNVGTYCIISIHLIGTTFTEYFILRRIYN